MHKKIRIIPVFISIICFCLVLNGCGSNTASDGSTPDTTFMNSEDSNDVSSVAADVIPSYDIPEEAFGSNIIDKEDATYIISSLEIRTYNKQTDTADTIWTSDICENGLYTYQDGCGVIVTDKIYFIEKTNSAETPYSLSVVGTNGTGYKQITSVSGYSTPAMLVLSNRLYINTPAMDLCYEIKEDGTLSDTNIDISENPEYKCLSEGCEISSFSCNGVKALFPAYTAEKYGKVLFRNPDYEMELYDINDGTSITTPGYIVSADLEAGKVLLESYNNDDYMNSHFTIIDLSTSKIEPSEFSISTKYSVHQLVDTTLFYSSVEYGKSPVPCIYSLDLSNGDINTVYSDDSFALPNIEPLNSYFAINYTKDYMYLPIANDYRLYIAKYDLASQSAKTITEPLYDAGIADIGYITYNGVEYYAEDNNADIILSARTSTINLSPSYSGAEKINKILNDRAANIISDANMFLGEAEEFYSESGNYFIPYSFEDCIYTVEYFDGTYIAFEQQGYDYYGGAHGMPSRTPFVFNVNTGEQLELTDIVGVDEATFGQLVIDAFSELLDDDDEYFWETAYDSVVERANFNSVCWALSKKGLNIYYYPYDLSSYARGFVDLYIPYDKLDLKIDLKEFE